MDLYIFTCDTWETAHKAEGIVTAEIIDHKYIRNPHYIGSQFYQVDDHFTLEIITTEDVVAKLAGLFTEQQVRFCRRSSLDVKMRKPTTKSQPNLAARLVFHSSFFR